jgi:hypothetical protein
MMKFIEIVVEGENGLCEGFIKGYFRGKGNKSPIINLEKVELQSGDFSENLEEFLHPGEEILHLLIKEEDLSLFQEAAESCEKEGIICRQRVTKDRTSVSANFVLKIYDKKRGEIAKNLLKENEHCIKLKKGVVEKYNKEEEEIELYAPKHNYELKAKGVIEGNISEIIDLYLKMKEVGFELKDVKLK